MRIAQIAPLIERVPPTTYGGTERVVSVLTEELVRRGHDVTLFASGDSVTSANLVATYPKPLREAMPHDTQKKVMVSLLHLGKAYERADEFDVIHDHTSHFGVAFANSCHTPVIMTMHGPFSAQNKLMYSMLRRPNLVTISKSQGKEATGLNHLGTVYNGLPMEEFPFSAQSEGYLLFVGRICPEKGVHHAITVAERLGLPLIIAAKLDVDRYGEYFEKEIKPRLTKKIRWIGEVNEEQRNKLYSKALCFLHALTWAEPFGLTLVEAMACGCPVVAFNKGSIPEIVAHGKTGFVVDTVEEMITVVKHISTIQRTTCREYALTTFNEQRMVSSYESLYHALATEKLSATQSSQLPIWSPSGYPKLGLAF